VPDTCIGRWKDENMSEWGEGIREDG